MTEAPAITARFGAASSAILVGDCRETLRTLPDRSVHCVVTSPPYWGLRDYGAEGQIGLERTPEEFIAAMVGVFREVRRVLRDDGTLWLNLGDCYATGAGKVGDRPGGGDRGDAWAGVQGSRGGSTKQQHNSAPMGPMTQPNRMPLPGLKPKDLCGIPWRVALALQADGWWLRRDVIWHKPNPMPESCTDRPTTAHEYVFLLTKRADYFYDATAIREPITSSGGAQFGKAQATGPGANGQAVRRTEEYEKDDPTQGGRCHALGRNKRSVWTIPTYPYPKAHFATFPPALVEPCVMAGTSEKGCCAATLSPIERVERREDKGWNGSKYGERAVAASGGAISGGTARSTLGSGNGKLVGQPQTIGWRSTCGAPMAREIAERPARGDYKAKGRKPIEAASSDSEAALNGDNFYREWQEPQTTGWGVTCSCYENELIGSPRETVPCTVLDPFAGAGTVGLVCRLLGRSFIGCEVNPAYAEMAMDRIRTGEDVRGREKAPAAETDVSLFAASAASALKGVES